MRGIILGVFLAIGTLSGWGINRADTIIGKLSLLEKVDMLFVVPSSDSIKVGNSAYVDYVVCDTRLGLNDSNDLPYPSEQTLLSVSDIKLKEKLYKQLLNRYLNQGFDGIVVPDTALGLARVYIGGNAVENRTFIQVTAFPCDLLSSLINKASIGVRSYGKGQNELPFFSKIKLPSLKLWDEKDLFGLSFNDIMAYDVLFWDDKSYECRQQMINAFRFGQLDETILDQRIARLLNYEIDTKSLGDVSISLDNRYELYKKSISIYQNKNILPVKRVDTLTASVYDYRNRKEDGFYSKLKYYHPGVEQGGVESFIRYCLIDEVDSLRSHHLKSVIERGGERHFNVLVYAGKSSKEVVKQLSNFDALVLMPEPIKHSWSMLVQAIYGGNVVDGVCVFDDLLKRKGLKVAKSHKTRLGFNTNVTHMFNTDSVAKIDKIIKNAIRQKATPGAQLLVVKSGDIILQKSYGHHTYKRKQKVNNEHLYDVASVTKMAVTFPMVMQLYEEGVINLAAPLSSYIPALDTTDKADITIRELLVHQSGLVSYIPFYNKALDRESLKNKALYSRHYSWLYNTRIDTRLYQNKNARYRSDVFSKQQKGKFQSKLTQSMFMNELYIDSMYNYIYSSPLTEGKAYRYSDLGYYLMQKVIEQEEKMQFDSLYYQRFTQRLGADKLLYRPLDAYNKDDVVPTENDISFRRVQLDGYVHDQGAAMLGGVAAHAGLFANAGDLAKMGQMFLNEGQYGGVRFVRPQTIGEFTKTVNHGNRRGLGVDKPELNPDKNSPVSFLASPSSYGHTGFTGTILWVDPEHDLIYIFLSNRIYPRAYNKKLIETNVRTKIQDVIYNSVVKS